MKNAISISDVQFYYGDPKDRSEGLCEWIYATLNGSIRLEAMTLRRTAEGNYAISFPSRFDHAGRKRFFYRPLNDRARIALERQIFAALKLTQSDDPQPTQSVTVTPSPQQIQKGTLS